MVHTPIFQPYEFGEKEKALLGQRRAHSPARHSDTGDL